MRMADVSVAAEATQAAGDPAGALALAERGVAKSPGCAACFETLSDVRASAGDVRGAIAAAERALELLPDRATSTALTARLAELRQAAVSRR